MAIRTVFTIKIKPIPATIHLALYLIVQRCATMNAIHKLMAPIPRQPQAIFTPLLFIMAIVVAFF